MSEKMASERRSRLLHGSMSGRSICGFVGKLSTSSSGGVPVPSPQVKAPRHALPPTLGARRAARPVCARGRHPGSGIERRATHRARDAMQATKHESSARKPTPARKAGVTSPGRDGSVQRRFDVHELEPGESRETQSVTLVTHSRPHPGSMETPPAQIRWTPRPLGYGAIQIVKGMAWRQRIDEGATG